jgi:hemoglobin
MTVDPHGTPERSPLYERLGGWGCIAVIAEMWCDRALADPRLAPHLQGADPGTLRKEQTEFLVHIAGGPVAAPARPLPSLYAQLPASPWHSERVLGHLIAALVWANLPRVVIEQVLDALGPLSPHTRPAPPPDPGPEQGG